MATDKHLQYWYVTTPRKWFQSVHIQTNIDIKIYHFCIPSVRIWTNKRRLYHTLWKVNHFSIGMVIWYREYNVYASFFIVFITPVRLLKAAPFTKMKSILIPAWQNSYIHCEVRDEITYSFLSLNGAAVKVWGWISNFIMHFIINLIIYPSSVHTATVFIWWPSNLRFSS